MNTANTNVDPGICSVCDFDGFEVERAVVDHLDDLADTAAAEAQLVNVLAELEDDPLLRESLELNLAAVRHRQASIETRSNANADWS